MDPKKNLKPELKEIYERVMSTKAAPRTTPPAQSPKPTTPPVSNSDKPPIPADQTDAVTSEPYLPSSAPRAITKRDDTFVFSNRGKNNTEQPIEKKINDTSTKASSKEGVENKNVSEEKKGQKSLVPVLIVVITIFLILYSVFWAFYFNII